MLKTSTVKKDSTRKISRDGEIADPFSVFVDYFTDTTNIVLARKDMREWFVSIYDEQCTYTPTKIRDLLCFKNEIIKLLEAAHFLYKSKKLVKVNTEITTNDGTTWDHLPHSLSFNDIQNPHAVLGDFFNGKDLGQWKELLEELVKMAVDDNAYDMSFFEEHGNLFVIQDSLFKLLDLTFFIVSRDINPSNGKEGKHTYRKETHNIHRETAA